MKFNAFYVLLFRDFCHYFSATKKHHHQTSRNVHLDDIGVVKIPQYIDFLSQLVDKMLHMSVMIHTKRMDGMRERGDLLVELFLDRGKINNF